MRNTFSLQRKAVCTKKKTALNLHVFCRHMREGAEKALGCSALVGTPGPPRTATRTHTAPHVPSAARLRVDIDYESPVSPRWPCG